MIVVLNRIKIIIKCKYIKKELVLLTTSCFPLSTREVTWCALLIAFVFQFLFLFLSFFLFSNEHFEAYSAASIVKLE